MEREAEKREILKDDVEKGRREGVERDREKIDIMANEKWEDMYRLEGKEEEIKNGEDEVEKGKI